MFHSRIGFGWGSGHDLLINIIEPLWSESALYTFMPPIKYKDCDFSTFIAGKWDNWVIKELEIFQLDPINTTWYGISKNSLQYIAMTMLEEEQEK